MKKSDGNYCYRLWAWNGLPLNTYISMYARTKKCYNKRVPGTNYVRSSITHCICPLLSESCINNKTILRVPVSENIALWPVALHRLQPVIFLQNITSITFVSIHSERIWADGVNLNLMSLTHGYISFFFSASTLNFVLEVFIKSSQLHDRPNRRISLLLSLAYE
jgi:hypothetical protein